MEDTGEREKGGEIDQMKTLVADAFDDAAKRLRDLDLTINTDELRAMVHDLEGKLQELAPEKLPDLKEIKGEVTEKVQAAGKADKGVIRQAIQDAEEEVRAVAAEEGKSIEEKVEGIEHFISDHPIASITIAAGAGFLLGLIAAKLR